MTMIQGDRGQATSHQRKPGWVSVVEVTLIRRINYIMKRVGGALLGSDEALLDLLPSLQILSTSTPLEFTQKIALLTSAE